MLLASQLILIIMWVLPENEDGLRLANALGEYSKTEVFLYRKSKG